MPPASEQPVLADPLTGFDFARDCVAGKPEALQFLPFLPAESTDFSDVIARRDAKPAAVWKAEEIAELVRFNRNNGNEAGATLAAQLGDPRTLVVVTGQQPNLFASPLFILLKALTAQSLATRIAAATGRPVIPLFWIASDDHDFRELSECFMLDASGGLHNLGDLVAREKSLPPGSPAYEWNLDSSAERLNKTISELLGLTENLPLATRALTAPATFESVFCRTLAAFMVAKPILFFAPRLNCARRRQREILRRELLSPGESSRLVAKHGAALEVAGYKPSIVRDPQILNAFYITQRMRTRLIANADEIICENPETGNTIRKFKPQELLDELEARPECFSPNVITRPVIQDAILPTITYVGGPGEVAYLAQLAPVFQWHGIPQASVSLRAFATLIDNTTQQALSNLGVSGTLADLSLAELEVKYLSSDPRFANLATALRQMEHALNEGMRVISTDPAAGNPHLRAALEKTTTTIRNSTNKLRANLTRQLGNAHSAFTSHARLTTLLAPHGEPQERILSLLSFCASYSPAEFADQLMNAIDFKNPRPQLAWLERNSSVRD